MADALDSKSSGVTPRAGSSPAFGTKPNKGCRIFVLQPLFVCPSLFALLRLLNWLT